MELGVAQDSQTEDLKALSSPKPSLDLGKRKGGKPKQKQEESDSITQNEYSMAEDNPVESGSSDDAGITFDAHRGRHRERRPSNRPRLARYYSMQEEWPGGCKRGSITSDHFRASQRRKAGVPRYGTVCLDESKTFCEMCPAGDRYRSKRKSGTVQNPADGPISAPSQQQTAEEKKGAKRAKLVKQASVVPIITDSSGAMKMTFWM